MLRRGLPRGLSFSHSASGPTSRCGSRGAGREGSVPMLAHILVLDDNVEVLETFAEILEDEGFRVTTCASGLVALLRIAQEKPDIIILDLKLTDTSGFEIHRALKAEPAFADIPIPFVSGVFLDEASWATASGIPERGCS